MDEGRCHVAVAGTVHAFDLPLVGCWSGYVSIEVLADWSDRHGTRGLSRAIRKVGRSDWSWAQALVLG
ncbi:hypothetical protein U1Q18_024741 [Sarracenia purpurea var. burkii]